MRNRIRVRRHASVDCTRVLHRDIAAYILAPERYLTLVGPAPQETIN